MHLSVRDLLRPAALAALLLAVPAAAQAAADKIPKPKVAVVDYQRLLKDSAAGKDVLRQIDAYRKDFQAEVRREEAKLREVEERLKRNRATMPADEFARKRREFEDQVISLQRRAQDSVRALDSAFQESMNRIHERLLPELEEVTRKQGYNVVIDRSKTTIAMRTIDVTEKVLEALDKKVPKLKVAKPAIK
jgi:outer membrane protein